MRKARVLVSGTEAGILIETEQGLAYTFKYLDGYGGPEVSRTMPVSSQEYRYDRFPPFFDGLLPEGYQLEGLLKTGKIDKIDLFSQLLAVGEDLIGVVTVKEIQE
jgi:serine/threonine-protein kinase HipA